MSGSERSMFVRWLEFMIAGKVLGIAAAVWIGGSAISRTLDFPALPAVAAAIVVMAMAGFAEGSLVGFVQAKVLGRAVPGFHSGTWAVTTGIATAAAWAIAMQANLIALDRELGAEELLLVVILLGGALGTIVGTVQWLQLRPRLPEAAGWIAANAVAWVAGTLTALGFLAFLGPESTPVALLLTAVGTGIAVGAAVGVITGAALIGLLHHPPPHSLTR